MLSNKTENRKQNGYILHYLHSDIILYLFETKNIFALVMLRVTLVNVMFVVFVEC